MKTVIKIFTVVFLLGLSNTTFATGNNHNHDHKDKNKPAPINISQKAEAEANAKAIAKASAQAKADASANQKQSQKQQQSLENSVDVDVTTGNVTVEATKALPGMHQAPTVSTTAPELFPGIQARPINISTLKDHRLLTALCGPVYSGTTSPIIKGEGASGITKFLLNSFQRGKSSMSDEADATLQYADNESHTVVCLGEITVVGDPSSGFSADLGVLESDAALAINKNVKINASEVSISTHPQSGKSGKYIWMVPIEAIHVIGVQNSSSGGAASGSGSHVNGVTILGIGVTYGGGNGHVYPDAKLGGTFYLFAPLNEGVKGTPLQFTNFSNVQTYMNQSVSNK